MPNEQSLLHRIWDSLLVGVPFAVFKFSAGWYASQRALTTLGLVMMTWGIADLAINLVHIFAPAKLSYCVLSNVGRFVDKRTQTEHVEAIWLAIDTLVALGIVAAMVGFRLLPLAPSWLSRTWDAAVVANILGVGVQHVWRAVTRATDPP